MNNPRNGEFPDYCNKNSFSSFFRLSKKLSEGKINYSRTLAALVPFSATAERYGIAKHSRFDTNPMTASNIDLGARLFTVDLFQSPAMVSATDAPSPGITAVALFNFNHFSDHIKMVLSEWIQRIAGCGFPARIRKV